MEENDPTFVASSDDDVDVAPVNFGNNQTRHESEVVGEDGVDSLSSSDNFPLIRRKKKKRA